LRQAFDARHNAAKTRNGPCVRSPSILHPQRVGAFAKDGPHTVSGILVTDRRKHRGPHPDDARLFAPDMLPRLKSAVSDLSWLLSRGYASPSSLKIVGDRYELRERQRIAIGRSACSDDACDRRKRSQVDLAELDAQCLLIDGYNLLTTIEAALAGGVILVAPDGAYRDMASVHGTWRKVQETVPAAELLGRMLAERQVASVVWLLDRPVSNSGRLKTILAQIAEEHGWPWEIRLVPDPDKILRQTDEIVATADSAILDECRHWVNLARAVVSRNIPDAKQIDLSSRGAAG